jgi:hypothetical protein
MLVIDYHKWLEVHDKRYRDDNIKRITDNIKEKYKDKKFTKKEWIKIVDREVENYYIIEV